MNEQRQEVITRGINAFRDALEDENAHIDDALRLGLSVAISELESELSLSLAREQRTRELLERAREYVSPRAKALLAEIEEALSSVPDGGEE